MAQTVPFPTLSTELPPLAPDPELVPSSPLAGEAAEAAKVLYEMSIQQDKMTIDDSSQSQASNKKKLRSGVVRGLSFDLPPQFGSFLEIDAFVRFLL